VFSSFPKKETKKKEFKRSYFLALTYNQENNRSIAPKTNTAQRYQIKEIKELMEIICNHLGLYLNIQKKKKNTRRLSEQRELTTIHYLCTSTDCTRIKASKK
jgi:hypothetical protein